jgi:hypothetical protein
MWELPAQFDSENTEEPGGMEMPPGCYYFHLSALRSMLLIAIVMDVSLRK